MIRQNPAMTAASIRPPRLRIDGFPVPSNAKI
jgi:hypothetical protein